MPFMTFTCPSCSDNTEMEADFFEVRRGAKTTHTCPQCGYSEHR